jgi:hypothetical protein
MYLFFIRQFNDVDHITPIVWKMHSDGEPVAVLCLNPAYDLDHDYRLAFLRAQGVNVGYVYDERAPGRAFRQQAMRWASRACYAAANRLNDATSGFGAPLAAALQRRSYKLGKKCFKRTKRTDYDLSWARALLERIRPKALCFDHINPGRHVVDILLKAAETLSIPTFALPHGVFIYTNNDVRSGSTEEDRFDKFNHFDYIVTQNALRKDVLVRAGVDSAKIHVLGSARYSDEWMEQNKNILPRQINTRPLAGSGLKAVFMTTRFAYKIDVPRMLKTFDLLAGIDNLQLLVKPHTRSGSEADIYDSLPLSNVSNLSSVELCEWADIVLVIGSSILIEPLKLNKAVLYLKYLHTNKTQYEEMGACWTIHDEQELLKAITALQSDHQNVPYAPTNVNSFLAEIVYGGGPRTNVLETYAQFIVSRSGD